MDGYRVKIIEFAIFAPWLILSLLFSTSLAIVSNWEICTTFRNGRIIGNGACIDLEFLGLFFAGLIFMIILAILSFILMQIIPSLRSIPEDELGGEYFPLTIISLVFTSYFLFIYLMPHIIQSSKSSLSILMTLSAYPRLFGLHRTGLYFYELLSLVFAFATILTGLRYNKVSQQRNYGKEIYKKRGYVRNYSGIGISTINILVAILLINSYIQIGMGLK